MEMNIFCPQSIEAQFELEEIADLKLQIITPQSSSPIIAMKQDQLLGAYNLTSEYYKINWQSAMNLLSSANLDFLGNIPKNKDYTGKEIYSYLIPKNINLIKGSKENPTIVVRNGTMTSGILKEESLGVKQKNSLVQLVWDAYGVETTRKFLDNTTRLINNYNMYHGMTVGVKDLYITDDQYFKLQQIFDTKKLEVEHEITEIENNPDIIDGLLFETSVSQKLSVVRDDASKLIMNNMAYDNNFGIMTYSGSKGKPINIVQMVGCVGQQDFHNSRMLKNYNERTLPYFFKNDDRGEARGFIENSFTRGLTLSEFIFHHLAAREGLIDQTVRSVTPDTRIIIMENSQIKSVMIGDWIDKHLLESPNNIEKIKAQNMELLKITNKIYIPTVDDIGNVSWGEITAVTRHDPGLSLYEVTTRGGRKVTVPESKSLLIWNNIDNKFDKVNTLDVKIGDFMPVTSNLIQAPVIKQFIDMTEYFSKKEYIYGSDFIKAKLEIDNIMIGREHIPIGWWENNNGTTFILPYETKAKFQRTLVRSANNNIINGYLYPFASSREHILIPDKFQLNKENGIFIGLFLADGNVDIKSGYIQITKNDPIIRNFVKKWFDNLSITYDEVIKKNNIGTTSHIRGYSTILAKFLTNLVGHGSHNKHIPYDAFNAPDEFVIGLINGYISGDGTIGTDNIEASSCSEELIEGINMLCSKIGIFGKVSITNYKADEIGIKHNHSLHRLSIRSQWAKKFSEKIILLHPEKNTKLINIIPSLKHVNFIEQNDVVLDKIISINKIGVEKYPKLYDLTIPSTLNFGLANGLHVVDTAESGYIQRKLIKSTEDFMVNYDGTVRNAVGRIQQFMYGDSGADTVKQYEYKFRIMEMGNKEIDSKYKFTKEEMSKLKNYSETDNVNFCKIIKNMRNHLRETQIKSTNNYLTLNISYMLPVNLNPIIDNFINDPDRNESDEVFNNPSYILSMIDDLLMNNKTRLYCMTEDEFKNPQSIKYKDDQMAKTALKYALYEALAPRRCIYEYKFSKNQIDTIGLQIIKSFNKSIVEPGEMVGIIAAQSLGEPVTQLMLNAFHSSGVGGKGGTNIGVDRIKEVFSLSKNPKEPYMVIYLEKKYRTMKDFANKIASHIKHTTIKDLRTKIEIFYDPKPLAEDGFMKADNVSNIFFSYQQGKQCCLNTIDGLPWLMRIEFDKEKLLNKEVTLLDIKSQFCFHWEKRYQDIKGLKREKRQILEKITQLAVLSNTDNNDIPCVHIRFDMTNFNSSTLVDFMDMFIDDFKLKGAADIIDIRGGGKAIEDRMVSFDNDDEAFEPKNTEFVIYTKGINMNAIKNIIGVDLDRTYCNDIITTFEIFGIEAARNLIIREIILVLTSNGSNTNYQHIQIFGDIMTNVGTLTSIDRFGLNKLDTDPLSRASFEKTVDQLITAAVFNEIDYMKSVSSRIMAGLCIKGGTGLCSLILDKELLENSEYTTDIGQLYKKTYEDITSNQQKQEIDNDIFIPEM